MSPNSDMALKANSAANLVHWHTEVTAVGAPPNAVALEDLIAPLDLGTLNDGIATQTDAQLSNAIEFMATINNDDTRAVIANWDARFKLAAAQIITEQNAGTFTPIVAQLPPAAPLPDGPWTKPIDPNAVHPLDATPVGTPVTITEKAPPSDPATILNVGDSVAKRADGTMAIAVATPQHGVQTFVGNSFSHALSKFVAWVEALPAEAKAAFKKL